MSDSYYSKQALIERYPYWRKHIEQGDFKVYLNPSGCLVIEWPNTSVFRPSYDQLTYAVHTEYSEPEYEAAQIHSSLMSLQVVTSLSRKPTQILV